MITTGRARERADTVTPLLRAKFSVPKARGMLLPRGRLFNQLGTGVQTSALTYVSAPKGWGKTSLVASWIAHDLPPGQVAWLSLDTDDDDPVRFWASVLAAVTMHGVAVPAALGNRPRTTVDRTFLDGLAAAVQDGPSAVVLVLDRFEVITQPGIVHDLDQVTSRARGDLRVVMISRRESLAGLPSCLLTEDVTLVGTHDLAFTTEETRGLLAQHGLSLDPVLVADVQRQTAGRADSLRLRAAAMASGVETRSTVI